MIFPVSNTLDDFVLFSLCVLSFPLIFSLSLKIGDSILDAPVEYIVRLWRGANNANCSEAINEQWKKRPGKRPQI